MICSSCTKKCNNSHCSESYNLIEACKSGNPFREIGKYAWLVYVQDYTFNYIKYLYNNEVYVVTQESFFKEYEIRD